MKFHKQAHTARSERNATEGVFGKVARGLGRAPGSLFRCLSPLSPPSPWLREPDPPPPPGSIRTSFSFVARGLGSARRWAGDFGAIPAGGGWLWQARAGQRKLPPAILRREIHGL